MNRLIKFRAWDELDRKMSIWTLNDLLVNFGYSEINDRPSPFFDYMQYTGLKDKNGKEIYEGDIVKLTYPVMPEWAEQKRVVEWLDNKCKFSICVGDAREVKEIIGNIYENKELLSGN